MYLIWAQHSQEEDWGLILSDARNEDNWIAMLWGVPHECPSGAQFTINCYRRWATLVVRDTEYRSGHFLYIKEGVTQGGTLALISYVIGVLPLTIELGDTHPSITQPWYADDVGKEGKLGHIMEHSQDLHARGTLWGYFLEPTNSILVVDLRNVARAEEFFHSMGINIVAGGC